MVIDTSTDNISNSPKLQKQKQGTFSPIIETDDASNPFAEDIKELAKIAKKSNLKDVHISFGDEEEEKDKFDEEAFRKKREHFQKTKSRSEHKSIILRVSNLITAYIDQPKINFFSPSSGFTGLSRRRPRPKSIPVKEACVVGREIVEAVGTLAERNIVVGG